MALFASIMGALSLVPNFKTRSHLFPMWIDPGTKLWVGPVEYSYPYLPFILSTTQAALVDILVPVVTILVVQIWVRRFWDANAALFALFKALIVMYASFALPTLISHPLSIPSFTNPTTDLSTPNRTLLQQILKQYIGGLRPYFLSVCAPSLPALSSLLSALPTTPAPTAYHRIFVSPSICLTPLPQLHQHLALASFPSGHAGNAFAAATVLALYLNAKLQAFADLTTGFWKQLAVLAPLVGAALVAGNELLDHHHHVGDVLAGLALGSLAGAAAYRAHFAGLWDARNHVPLPYAGMRRAGGVEKIGIDGDEDRTSGLREQAPRPAQGVPGANGLDGADSSPADPRVRSPYLSRAPSHARVRGPSDNSNSTDPHPGAVDWQISSNGRVRSDGGVYSNMRMGRVRSEGEGEASASVSGEGAAAASLRGVRGMRFSGSMQGGGPVVGIHGVLAEGEMVGSVGGGGGEEEGEFEVGLKAGVVGDAGLCWDWVGMGLEGMGLLDLD